MPLDTATLLATLRRDLDDPEMPGAGDDSDSLWSDVELTDYLAEAQEIACTKADILFDQSTFTITTVADGDGLYAWDELITKIRKGIVTGQRVLTVMSVSDIARKFDVTDLGWTVTDWEDSVGDPQYIVTDYEVGYVRLVPIPVTADEVIKLHVYRLPADNAVMEIPNKYRRELLLYAKYKAYDKHDADVHNETLAVKYKALWEQALIEMKHEEKRRNKGLQVVAYGGI
jgi:hypothetical protein